MFQAWKIGHFGEISEKLERTTVGIPLVCRSIVNFTSDLPNTKICQKLFNTRILGSFSKGSLFKVEILGGVIVIIDKLADAIDFIAKHI